MTHPESSNTEQELELLASLRDLQSNDWQLDSPPAHVWAGIERAIREQPMVDELPLPTVDRSASGQPGRKRPGSTRRAPHLALRQRWWLVAASIVAVLGVGAVGLALFGNGRSGEVVVAAVELTSDDLDGAPAGLRGNATVIETTDGEIIQVEIGNLRAASGEFLEVWLIRPDVSGMVSLGTARPDGRYELPPGLRIADFPIVDVSTEPYDGNPVHSGASLLRGLLPN